MTRAQLALRLAVVSLPIAFAVPRAAAPRYTLKEDWRIAASDNVRDVGFVKMAPNGRVIFAPYNSGDAEIVAFDTATRKPVWRVPVGWGRDKEVRGIQAVGFTGATMWVSDRSYHQVALIDANGKVTKSLEHPAFVRPTLSDRRKFPVFDAVDALAVYADGTWLVRPLGDRSENRLVDTPEYDSTSVHLLRINESGVIQRIIAKYPEVPVIEIREPGMHARMDPLFANRALFAVSQDGMRIVVVMAALSGKDSATYRVTSLNERGDTMFTKKFPFTPERISAVSRDSALRRVNTPRLKAEQEKRMPGIFMPVVDVTIGYDRTTWLKLRSAPSDSLTMTYAVLDPHGEVQGTVVMPTSVYLIAGDSKYVWGVERQKGNLRTLVRYKLIPAK